MAYAICTCIAFCFVLRHILVVDMFLELRVQSALLLLYIDLM